VREIPKSRIGQELARLMDEGEPDEEDIGIFDDDGNLLRVLISEPAYRFFSRKAEEAEDLSISSWPMNSSIRARRPSTSN
jgi:hypothetical protein